MQSAEEQTPVVVVEIPQELIDRVRAHLAELAKYGTTPSPSDYLTELLRRGARGTR